MSQVFALASAQTVSLKKQNASLEEILWELKEKTQLVFMYSDEDIASVKGIDIDMKNTQVDAILNKCLEGTDLKYVRENNAIVIRRSRQSENVPQVRMRKISGKVTDTSGDPLPGVTILVDGTTIGVATDNEGIYSLECPEAPDLALNFTFMGMKSQKVTVGPKNVIDVTLEEEMNRLEEAVAVGYGTTKVKDMTGAVTRLGSKDMETAPMGATIQSMLQGKAPGVNVMISSASPTSPVSVIIRGSSSLSGDSQPLWVIDGVPEYNASTSGDVSNTLYNLNLTDVESIDILKDASATAIYGSRAANGVVLVTTKRGKAGMKPQLEFSARYGIQTMNANDFRVLTADEYIRVSKAACAMSLFTRGSLDYFTKKYVDETYFNSHINHSQFDLNSLTDEFYLKDAYGNGDTDWWDLMTRNAATQDYSIGIRGGSKESSYSASIYYKDQKGIVKGGNSKMLGGSFNFDAAVRDIVRFKLDLRATARTANDKDNMIGEILDMRPDVPAYNEDGTINMIDYYTKNPLLSLMDTDEAKGRNFSGTLGLEWDIIKGLTFRTSGTVQYNVNKYNTYTIAWYDGAESSASVSKNESYTYMWDNTLNYVNTWKKHSLVGLAGFSIEKYESDGLGASGSGFPDDQVLTNLNSAAKKNSISSSYSSNTLASFLSRLEYKFNNRYLLTLNFRADGSSQFGPDKRWGYFPSGAVAWIITEENFMKDYSNIVSYLKLRGSVGKTGSQNLGAYDWRTLMGSATYNGAAGIVPSSLGNDILQWEEQIQKEVGLDYGFWDDRIRGTLGYYQKKVDNLLYSDPVPTSSSFSSVYQNIGSLKNRGIEFDVRVDIIKNAPKDLTWNVDFNIARNRTTLEKLNSSDGYFGGGAYDYFKIEEGGETGRFYGYKDAGRLFMTNEELVGLKTIDPKTGTLRYYRDDYNYERQGDVYIMDLDGDGQITADGDRTVIGNANPDFFGGFGSTLYWKGLMLNAVFSYSVGGDRFWDEEKNSSGDMNVYNTSNRILDSWTVNPGVNASYPRAMYYGWGSNSIITDRYIHDASYLRMTALNLSYRLPKHLYKNSILNAVEFTFQATNLFTWTKYPGMDPQGNFSTTYSAFYNMGIDYSTYPSARTYNFGIKLTLK
jgi:tonB-linked outer membrane protein, susC/ragA family